VSRAAKYLEKPAEPLIAAGIELKGSTSPA
jgi:hypothetical protein